MDYSTIVSKLEKGEYAPLTTSDSSSTTDSSTSKNDGEMDAMEEITLQVLMDIEQVYHNCFLYNQQGVGFFRAGVVQEGKWKAYFNKFIADRLPEGVMSQLEKFRTSCKDELSQIRAKHFQATVSTTMGVRKAIAVFDPDTRRIVKQYTSKAAARIAADMLFADNYACEWDLTQVTAKTRIENAEDPEKPLFGYQVNISCRILPQTPLLT